MMLYFIFYFACTLPLISKSTPLLPSYSADNRKIDRTESFIMENIPEEDSYGQTYSSIGKASYDMNVYPAAANTETARRQPDEAIVSSPEALYSGYDFSSINSDVQQRKSQIETESPATPPAAYNNEQGKPQSDAFVMNPMPITQFILPPKDSAIPKIKGVYVKEITDDRTDKNIESEKAHDFGGAISNPAAYYLNGSNIENIKAPNCRMVGCNGPFANDYDFFLQHDNIENESEACHRAFVPLNGCVNGLGYPIGMVCTICCDCTADLVRELKNSRGYVEGYKTK